MVDLGGYVIILVETKDKRVKLYGSPADKAELEVADEILEINGKTLQNCSHAEVINHIHNCIKSRTICLRVKRRTGNKLAEELAEHNNVQDAFVIAVEQQARERLEKLSALRKIKPVDMTALSQELCDDKTGTKTPIYSAPVSEIGSTQSVKAVVESEGKSERSLNSQLTEEELELNQRINRSRDPSANPSTARSRDQSAHKPGTNTCRSRDPSASKSCNRSRDSSANKPACSRESVSSSGATGGGGHHVGRAGRCSVSTAEGKVCSAAAKRAVGHSRNSSRDSLASCKSREVTPHGGSGPGSRSCSRTCDRQQVACLAGSSGVSGSSRQPVLADSAGCLIEPKGGGNIDNLAAENSSLNFSKRPGTDKCCDRNQICDNNSAQSQPQPSAKDKRLEPALDSGQGQNGTAGSTSGHQDQHPNGHTEAAISKNVDSDAKTNGDEKDSNGDKTTSEKGVEEGENKNAETEKEESKTETEANNKNSKGINRSEVLIGGDTEGNRSARESFRERHQVKTFSETKTVGGTDKPSPVDQLATATTSTTANSTTTLMEKPALRPTYSLKTVLEVDDMSRCIDRISKVLESSSPGGCDSAPCQPSLDKCTSTKECTSKEDEDLNAISLPQGNGKLANFRSLVQHPLFKSLIKIHNTIQLVQCFRCPPPALCTDVRDLVQECMMSLQGCPLPEAAEILDILNRIEFEALFYSHDKLADLQGGMPWNKCLAEMWQKEKHVTATPDSNTRVVRITKQNEPLGATVRNEGEKVVIGRVVKGGAAERSGNLHPGDEVLEVNGLRLKGKSVHDICATLCQMSGTLTFVIIPGTTPQQDEDDQPVYHYRAHFSYSPEDDLYIPCHELGISFQRGDILHVINKSDPHWWQAYRDGEWTQTLAGLIPSLDLQDHRMAMQKQTKEDVRERSASPARKKSNPSLFCAKKTQKRKSTAPPLTKDFPPYEEMALYYPQPNQRRPLILVGPPSIGRHELRQRLLDQAEKFAAPVPHTTRPKEEGEINGIDYHFVSKSEFERLVDDGKFLEHGEYDKQMYGTTITSVRNIIASGKICVLNIQITSLPGFHESDLKPYVVFLTPASPHMSRHIKCKNGEAFKEEEYRELVIIAHNMEEYFGHYFDSVIPFQDVDFVYKQVMYEMSLLEKEPQWVPAKWVH